ncbi:hypothetical protein SADUNF_Sadunf10G0137800 [Salix dunnii]|uniref:Amino acid transporter transmembrane domain-containing protein n=1 Tax=Salix dunnii TaxID=1413687 RepID=A0A835MV32_9ROSI|nr:hypothetical protein SADUNF_Sadunf10G0137800 [Salix dunnii]
MSPATGKHAPLLPKKKQGEKRASVHGAVFNVSTSIIGAGIMSIPATLKVLGVIPALVLIMIIAWLVDISVEFLLRYTHSGESTTYAGVMREVFGRVGSVSVQICVMITNLGCLIIYLIIIGDVLSGNVNDGSMHLGVLQEWFGFHWWNSRAFALLFVVILVMLPLVLIRRVGGFNFQPLIFYSSLKNSLHEDLHENKETILNAPERLENNEGSCTDSEVKESNWNAEKHEKREGWCDMPSEAQRWLIPDMRNLSELTVADRCKQTKGNKKAKPCIFFPFLKIERSEDSTRSRGKRLFTLVGLFFPESLRFSSAISVLLAVVFVGICSVMSIYALIGGKTKTPRLLPHLDNKTSFLDLFTAVPVIVTAFTFHFNVHPISSDLGKPSDMISAVKISLLLCAGIYFSTGIFGYLLFGESIVADILVNFDQSSDTAIGALLNDTVRLSYAFHLMLAFPLLNFSLRANIDELLFPKKPLLEKDSIRFASLTLVLLVFAYLAAIAIPNIWYFFQFMGSTSAVCLAFIFPGAIVLRDVHSISTTRDKIVAAVMIILAVTTSTIALSTNIYSLVRNK